MTPSGGDWVAYENSIYQAFCEDFVYRQTTWRGLRVSVRYEPSFNNKGDTFWHCVTAKTERTNTRDPDLRRCERIHWIRAVLEAPEEHVREWVEQRNGERVVIALQDFSYLVVVRPVPAQSRVQLITAFYVEWDGRREKFRRECEAAVAAGRQFHRENVDAALIEDGAESPSTPGG